MRVGYACLTLGVEHTNYKKVLLKNVTEEKLREIIVYNLKSLKNVILYNIENEISLFRISSDLIPFGSSGVNQIKWWQDYKQELMEVGQLIKKVDMRVSFHPGQYTVINSFNDEVVKRALLDVEYHAQLLESMELDEGHKIVLHIGGIYQRKEQAIEQFIHNFKRLSEKSQKRVVIENDDKSYHIEDLLAISKQLNIPVVFDNLHNALNPPPQQKSEQEWIKICRQTWKKQDGPQKIHYSQQAVGKQAGSHSATIYVAPFLLFFQSLQQNEMDIMLEVKDKNLSALKISRLLHSQRKIHYLEKEWQLYKYLLLEKSQQHYQTIRTLLQDKKQYPAFDFYQTIEQALGLKEDKGQAMNAAMHVWGYVKNRASEKEKQQYLKLATNYEQGRISLNRLKNFLQKMVEMYQQTYVMESYYFLDSNLLFKEGNKDD